MSDSSLSPSQRYLIDRLCAAALERAPADRESFIREHAGEDDAVIAEALSLLEIAGGKADLLDQIEVAPNASAQAAPGSPLPPTQKGPASPPPQPVSADPKRFGGLPAPGDKVGPYILREQIGEGGFGVVFKAEQTEPVRRFVALKIIKPGMDSKEVVARFEAERQALAMMDHPGIAKVLGGGATERGLPFFVMEYVKGEPITKFCDRQRLGIRDRLDLFMRVCEAVQHAHMKGILHRDIKPTNILAGYAEGATEANGSKVACKVIDFGVAKALNQRLTDQTVYTGLGVLIGTPEYMSPEQAEMGQTDVDTRSDVYSLGVLLYELLTGARPFDLREAALAEAQRIIRDVDPPRPSTRLSTLGDKTNEIAKARRIDKDTLTRSVRGELEWITLRSLKKDRQERYGSASDLARDIKRHLDGDAVEAGPDSRRYKLNKFIKKNKGPVAAVLAVFAVLLLGISGTGVGLYQADKATQKAEDAATQERIAKEDAIRQRDERDRALKERDDARAEEQIQRQAASQSAEDANIRGIIGAAQFSEFLGSHLAPLVLREVPADQSSVPDTELLRALEGIPVPLAVHKEHEHRIVSVDWQPGGTLVASADIYGKIAVRDLADPTFSVDLDAGGGPTRVVWAPDGSSLAAASLFAAVIWNPITSDAKELMLHLDHENFTRTMPDIAWHQFAEHVVFTSNDDEWLITYNLREDERNRFRAPDTIDKKIIHTEWHPSKEQLLTLYAEDFAQGDLLLLSNTGDLLQAIDAGSLDTLQDAAFHPSGKFIAIAEIRGDFAIYSVDSPDSLFIVWDQDENPLEVEWSPDGERLLAISEDGTVRIWTYFRDDRYRDGAPFMRREELKPGPILPREKRPITELAWNTTSDQLLITSGDTVECWRLDDLAVSMSRRHPSVVASASWDFSSTRFVSASESSLWLWAASHANELGVSSVIQRENDETNSVIWSPDGTRFAVGTDTHVSIYTTDSNDQRETRVSHSDDDEPLDRHVPIAWSPDGTKVLVYGPDDDYDLVFRIHDLDSPGQFIQLGGEYDYANAVEWSPDGEWIAIDPQSGPLQIYSASDGSRLTEEDGTLPSPSNDVWPGKTPSWSPDGSMLASMGFAERNGDIAVRVQIVRIDGSTLPLALDGYDVEMGPLTSITWNPDATVLAIGTMGGHVLTWDANDGSQVKQNELAEPVTKLAFSPDAKQLLVGTENGSIHLWNAVTLESSTDAPTGLKFHSGPVVTLQWLPESDAFISQCVGYMSRPDPFALRWDLSDLRRPLILGRPNGGSVVSADLHPEGSSVLVAHVNGVIREWPTTWSALRDRLWKIEAWLPAELREYLLSENPAVARMHQANDERYFETTRLAALNGDNPPPLPARAFDQGSREEGVLFQQQIGAPAEGIAWSPDGTRIAIADERGRTRIWQTEGANEPVSINEPAESISWSKDGRAVLTWTRGGDAFLWDDQNLERGTRFPIDGVRFGAWSPTEHKVLLIGDVEETGMLVATVFAPGSGTAAKSMRLPDSFEHAAWEPDGASIAFGLEGFVGVWDPYSEDPPRLIGFPNGSSGPSRVTQVSWSPDREWLAASYRWTALFRESDDDGVLVWGEWSPRQILWSPDGKHAALMPQDGDVVPIWTTSPLETGTAVLENTDAFLEDGITAGERASSEGGPRLTLQGHSDYVFDGAWSPDGRLATISRDRTIRIWDMDDPQNPKVLMADSGEFEWLAWSPDGQQLLTASDDGNVRIWDVATD